MLRKKICMLGAFAVGKTSLVARFVRAHSTGALTDKYHTTVGVKIDTKIVDTGDQSVSLAIWDMAGEDDFQKARISNLTGAGGYLLVADGTRNKTLDTARSINERVVESFGALPFVLVLNKTDLTEDWEIEETAIRQLTERGWRVIRSSAKSGAGVEEAFKLLTELMLK